MIFLTFKILHCYRVRVNAPPPLCTVCRRSTAFLQLVWKKQNFSTPPRIIISISEKKNYETYGQTYITTLTKGRCAAQSFAIITITWYIFCERILYRIFIQNRNHTKYGLISFAPLITGAPPPPRCINFNGTQIFSATLIGYIYRISPKSAKNCVNYG
jgi:hypothetical protein